MAAKTIKEKALLVNVDISLWSATKSDSETSRKAELEAGAKTGTFRGSKNLIDKSALTAINSIKNQTCRYVESVTMPWFDNGYRILPSKKYMEFTEKIRTFKAEFTKEIENITDNYALYIDNSRKTMGKMFKLHEYPTVSDIEGKFTFNTAFMPMPDVSDFRIDLNDSEIARLQSDMQANMALAEKNAMNDLFKRLYDRIAKVVERLSDPENSFKDSLFDNLEDLLNLLPEMNITYSKELKEIIKETKTKVLKNPDSIRLDDSLREKTYQAAQEMLSKIEDYSDC